MTLKVVKDKRKQIKSGFVKIFDYFCLCLEGAKVK